MAAALLAVLCCRASCGEGALFRRSGHRAVGLTAAQARSGFEIPDVLIIAGSDSLSVWGEPLLRGADYSIDPETRTLRLLSALPDTTRLILRYAHLPLGLAPVYQRARAETSASLPPGFPRGPALVEDTGAGRAAEPLGAGLRVGGAKTFGITVGSDRDLSLEQSLRVSVSGSITDDVAVNAYLSDQNTPLVPEGDTEELRALDKVLIELTGERVSATMGDYELAIDGGSLATVRRELSGAKVTAEVGPGTVLLAGARLRGEFTSVTLAGVDGKQGPYLLTDRSGAAGVVVVAGSERVWLDGEQLARGRDRDYVIDYAAGEIELTERRPVSSDNTITVDYEYALGDYGRDIYGGRGVLPLFGGAASVGASFMREVDDRTAGEGAVLSDEDVAILEAAGDDPSLAHDDGVEYTGAGEGDYVLVEEGVFEYAGADSGDYDLSFERADGGDYDYDYVRGAYVHVGPGEGDYRLGRSLPRPIDRGLAAADVRFALPGGGSVVAEGAVSNFDRNTFSDLDDGDNTGNAELMSARLPAIGLGGDAAELALGVSARRVGGRFEGIGRFRELRYEEKWELQGLELPEREALVEGTAALTLRGGGRFDLSYGRLERGDELGSSKAEFSVTARPNGRSRVWANGRLVDLDYAAADSVLARRRTLYRAGVEHSIGFVVPSAVYSHDERSTDRGGERYDEYGGSLASSGRGAYSFRAAYSRRLTDRSDGDSWGRASTTRTQEYALGLSGSDRLTVDASVLRRAIDVEPGLDEPGSRYDLASLRLGHRSFDGAVSGEARYTVTATEIEEKERYVTVEDGVEITRVVPTGRYVPVTDLSAGTRWTVAFRRSSGSRALPDARALARFLAGVSLETDVKLREVSTTDDHRRLYLLSPDVIQGAETVRGEISARHAARYAAPGGRLSVRLSLSSRDELDRSYTNASDARKERAGTIDVKVSHGRSLVYRAQADLASRDQRASGAGSSYEIRESSLLAEATVSAWTELELRLTGSLTRQDERLAAADVTIVRITPAATYRLKGRGALSLSVTRAEVESTLDALPSYLGQGSPPGVTSEWRLSGDYRLNRYLTGSLSYTGEARPGAETRHTLDMRVNAYF
jgi:hypothetical protein